MEKITFFTPAFDKRHSDPKKDYGVHSVELHMILKGELGAVSFTLFTNWHLPSVDMSSWPKSIQKPMPAGLSYHSPKPIYEDEPSTESCEWLNGNKCYSDVSYTICDKIFQILLTEGSDGVWKYLEEYYIKMFNELK